jgi:hypothetical protein
MTNETIARLMEEVKIGNELHAAGKPADLAAIEKVKKTRARRVAKVEEAPVEASVEEAPVEDLGDDGQELTAELEAPVDLDAMWTLHVGGAKSVCAGLRSLAFAWEGSRKLFIELAVSKGVNKATAATQYQLGHRA